MAMASTVKCLVSCFRVAYIHGPLWPWYCSDCCHVSEWLVYLNSTGHGDLAADVEAALFLPPQSVDEGAVTKDQVLHVLLRLAILKEQF